MSSCAASRRTGLVRGALFTVGLALTATGCGGSGTGTGGQSTATGSTSAASPTSPTSPTSSASSASIPPSASAASSDSAGDGVSGSAGVAPASGKSLSLDAVTFNVPQGWRVLSGSQNKANVTLYDAQSDAINVESAQRFGDETYQDEAKNIPRSLKSQHVTVTQQPDRTINGVAGYVFSGSGSAYPFYYEFGTVSNDHVVTVVLAGGATTPAGRATAEADLESLLASIVWT